MLRETLICHRLQNHFPTGCHGNNYSMAVRFVFKQKRFFIALQLQLTVHHGFYSDFISHFIQFEREYSIQHRWDDYSGIFLAWYRNDDDDEMVEHETLWLSCYIKAILENTQYLVHRAVIWSEACSTDIHDFQAKIEQPCGCCMHKEVKELNLNCIHVP